MNQMDLFLIFSKFSVQLQGFVMNRSANGGTGAGLGSLILEQLADDYKRQIKFGCEVYDLTKFPIDIRIRKRFFTGLSNTIFV